MSRNWIRAINLQVGDNSGSTIDLSAMRVKFLVRQASVQSPNPAEVRVYNLSKETAKIVAGKGTEFKHITLSAGYKDNVGVIYKGSTIGSQTGRESPTETFADFFCRDGDQAYNWAHLSKTFAAGSRQQDHVDAVLKVMEPFGIKRGVIKGLSEVPYPRAVTLYQLGRDVMRTIAKSNNAYWDILNGELNHIPLGESTNDGKAFALNANTGLIGMPQETVDGIVVTALINPAFRKGTRLQIDEASINRAPWTTNYDADVKHPSRTDGVADGEYIIDGIEWRGDTHGLEWYATMICHGAQTGQQSQGTLTYTGG